MGRIFFEVDNRVKKNITVIIVIFVKFSFAELQMPEFATTLTELLMMQDYKKALLFADSIIAVDPENIDAQYMRLNILQTKMLDYESYPSDSSFIKQADNFLNLLTKQSKNYSGDEYTKLMLFRGNIIGSIALIETKQENWINGFKKARLSVKILADTFKRDTTFYEACLATGVYDYYVGKTFKWVPFVGKRESVGISQIERAASRNSLFKFAAIHSLLWIYIEKKEYETADSLVNILIEQYPNNTILLRVKARNEFLRGNDENAFVLGNRLKDVSSRRVPINWSDMFSGYEIVIRLLMKQKRYEECQKIVDMALSYKVPAAAKKIVYVRDNLEYIGVTNVACKKAVKAKKDRE